MLFAARRQAKQLNMTKPPSDYYLFLCRRIAIRYGKFMDLDDRLAIFIAGPNLQGTPLEDIFLQIVDHAGENLLWSDGIDQPENFAALPFIRAQFQRTRRHSHKFFIDLVGYTGPQGNSDRGGNTILPLAGFGQQHGAEVESGVAALAFLGDPFQAEGAAAAAQVEPVAARGDGFGQQAADAGLDAAAGVGEGVTKGLVEFTVNSEECLAGVFLHGMIITPPTSRSQERSLFCGETAKWGRPEMILCGGRYW